MPYMPVKVSRGTQRLAREILVEKGLPSKKIRLYREIPERPGLMAVREAFTLGKTVIPAGKPSLIPPHAQRNTSPVQSINPSRSSGPWPSLAESHAYGVRFKSEPNEIPNPFWETQIHSRFAGTSLVARFKISQRTQRLADAFAVVTMCFSLPILIFGYLVAIMAGKTTMATIGTIAFLGSVLTRATLNFFYRASLPELIHLGHGQMVITDSLFPVSNHRSLFWTPDGRLLNITGNSSAWYATEIMPTRQLRWSWQDVLNARRSTKVTPPKLRPLGRPA